MWVKFFQHTDNRRFHQLPFVYFIYIQVGNRKFRQLEFAERQRGAEEGKKKQAGAGKGQGIKPFGDCGKSKEGRKRREGRARGKGWRQTFFGAGESRGRQARSGFVIENGCLCGFVRKAERGKSREKDSERQTQKPTAGEAGKNKLCFSDIAQRFSVFF